MQTLVPFYTLQPNDCFLYGDAVLRRIPNMVTQDGTCNAIEALKSQDKSDLWWFDDEDMVEPITN